MKSAPPAAAPPPPSMVTTHSLLPPIVPPRNLQIPVHVSGMPPPQPIMANHHNGMPTMMGEQQHQQQLTPVRSTASMGAAASAFQNGLSPASSSDTNDMLNANNKRSLMTTNKDGKQLSEKKLRRLEKNRLSARECRRRKRQATEDVERQINVLEGENLRLRLQLSIGEEAEETLGKEQEEVTEEIDGLLKSGASEGEIYATIEEFKEKFADYGRDRRSAIQFHLQNVERLLQPTQTTSVAMRALHGGGPNFASKPQQPSAAEVPAVAKSATGVPDPMAVPIPTAVASAPVSAAAEEPAEPSAEPSEATSDPAVPPPAATNIPSPKVDTTLLQPKKLFTHLVNYLQVTSQQAGALKDSRWVARDLDQSLATSLSVLQELRDRLNQIGDGMETEFNNVRSILTPTQAAKFLVWVADNRACMHMLNELWSRVYPDPDDAASVEEGKSSPTSP